MTLGPAEYEPAEPKGYISEEPVPPNGLQDDEEPDESAHLRALTAPRDYAHALMWALGQHKNPTRDWYAMCQAFVRSCYAIPPLFGSAYAQWLGAKASTRHAGGHPSAAPLGSALCYKGSSPYGHIMLAARDFPDGSPGAWSTDLVRRGKVDKVHRNAPVTAWGQHYLGYLTAVNNYTLPLQPVPVPKPTQVPYPAIASAIDDLKTALATATHQGDTADVTVLKAEIARLTNLYNTLRKNA